MLCPVELMADKKRPAIGVLAQSLVVIYEPYALKFTCRDALSDAEKSIEKIIKAASF